MDWLVRNYFRPWKNIFEMADRIERYKKVEVPPPPPQKIVYVDRPVYVPVETQPKTYVLPQTKKDDCGCTCILF